MAKIEVRCPICSLWDNIEISDDATKNVSKGLLAINIASGMICEHSFIAYVDKNLVVRDCIVADFKIELPESEAAKKSEESITPETDSIKFDLIKLNIPDMLMVYVFRTIFFGKKALILSDHEFLYNHIVNFFKYVMQNSFEFDLRIISEMDYKKNKSEYKDYLVFKNREIIKDKEQLINPKRLEIEKLIVQKFFAEYDLMAGLIILRNEINKAYEFSKSIIQYLENQKGNPLTSKII
ncbi:MAG: hypothetical protein ACFFCL_06950, partial [Promethearchaeota archaeon]